MTTHRGTGGLAAQEMPLIHRIFRHELRALERIVIDVPSSAAERAGHVADHLEFLLDALRHHHEGEDELLWPVLLERVGDDAPLVAPMAEQHDEIDRSVGVVRTAAATWAERPTHDNATALAAAIGTLRTILTAHLDEEERVVVPLLDEHLTAEEWQQAGQAIFERFTPRQRLIATGQLLDVTTPEEARRMLADLPLPIRVMWQVVGKRQYRRYIGRVRGRQLPPALRRLGGRANRTAVALYRRSGGRIGGRAKGLPVLLVTVAGRRSGIDRTTPIVYFELDGDYLVCGSGGGMPAEPDWFRNLRRASRAAVTLGDGTPRDVTVRVLPRDERDKLWDDLVLERAPLFAKYEQRSARIIPLALLTPA